VLRFTLVERPQGELVAVPGLVLDSIDKRTVGSLKRVDPCNSLGLPRFVSKCAQNVPTAVFGDGPVELVFVGPFVSHVELFWTMTAWQPPRSRR
jgi:hypothetical protein